LYTADLETRWIGFARDHSTAKRNEQGMKAKGAKNEAPELQTRPIPVHVEGTSAHQTPRHEEICLRAYEIYLERGGLPENELDDWLQAERELKRAPSPVAQELSYKVERE
jgi:hypothetical protein